jgi:hypothetical protein
MSVSSNQLIYQGIDVLIRQTTFLHAFVQCGFVLQFWVRWVLEQPNLVDRLCYLSGFCFFFVLTVKYECLSF